MHYPNSDTQLQAGAKVIMIENAYVQGSSTPVSRTDGNGNAYQIRELQDGTQREVLKNFPAQAELQTSFSKYATDIVIRFLQYFRVAEYKTRENAGN